MDIHSRITVIQNYLLLTNNGDMNKPNVSEYPLFSKIHAVEVYGVNSTSG